MSQLALKRGLAILLLLVAAQAFAARKSARASIDRQYKRWASAALTNDVEGVLSILAPGYTLKTFDGTVIPLKKYEISLRKRKASGKKPNAYTTTIQSLAEAGSTAKVISLETSITDTPDPVTNKVQRLVHVHQYMDTWMKSAGRWKLLSTVTLIEKTTIGR